MNFKVQSMKMFEIRIRYINYNISLLQSELCQKTMAQKKSYANQ